MKMTVIRISKKHMFSIAVPALSALTIALGLADATAAYGEETSNAELLKQGRYWTSVGRQDIADQAYRQVLLNDPTNASARAGLNHATATIAMSTDAGTPKHLPAKPALKATKSAARDPSGNARAAGFKALNANELSKAETNFARALALNPSDAEAAGGLGIVRLRAGRFAEARDLLMRASKGNGAAQWEEALKSASYYADLAQARKALNEQRFNDAETTLKAILATGFDDGYQAETMLAETLSNERHFADAAQIYDDLAQKQPENATIRARAVRSRALDAEANGNTQDAERFYQQALVKNMQDPWLRYEYARFLIKQGRPRDAVSLVSYLQTSTDAQSLFAAGLILSQADKISDADTVMSRITVGDRSPSMSALMVDIKTRLAVAQTKRLVGQGRKIEALSTLRDLAKTNDLPVSTSATLAMSLLDLGDKTTAQALAARILAQPRTDVEAYIPVIDLLGRLQQWDNAQILLSDLNARNNGESQPLEKLRTKLAVDHADQLRTQGNFADAFDVLHDAWTASPDNLDVLEALAHLYQDGKMEGKALTVYNMVLAKAPDRLSALTGRAQAAAATGDYAGARRSVSRALSLAGDNPDILRAAARVEATAGNKRAAIAYLKKAQSLWERGSNADALTNPNPFSHIASEPSVIDPFSLDTGGTPKTPAGIRSVDPVLDQLQSQIKTLSEDQGTYIAGDSYMRSRSGETGLSKFDEVGAHVGLNTTVGGAGIEFSINPVAIDAGRPTGSALARFGINGLPEAEAIVAAKASKLAAADTQHTSGIGLSVSMQTGSVKTTIGTTPIGLGKTKTIGRVEWSGRVASGTTVSVYAESQPVKDSVISYAGTHDPVTGYYWGGVTKAGVGASIAYYADTNGIYADLAAYNYKGTATPKNGSFQLNAGGSLQVLNTPGQNLTTGVNLNVQSYRNNQNEFSFGHGGYFSPQSFASLSFPVHYTGTLGKWSIYADVAPGLQTYKEDKAELFPNLPTYQTQLNILKLANSDVRSYYDSASKTGFGISGGISLVNHLNESADIFGDIKVNTFGQYNEMVSHIGIKQKIGGQ